MAAGHYQCCASGRSERNEKFCLASTEKSAEEMGAVSTFGGASESCAAGAALRLFSCCSSAARRARSQLDTSFLTAWLEISWLLLRRRPLDGSVSRPRANLCNSVTGDDQQLWPTGRSVGGDSMSCCSRLAQRKRANYTDSSSRTACCPLSTRSSSRCRQCTQGLQKDWTVGPCDHTNRGREARDGGTETCQSSMDRRLYVSPVSTRITGSVISWPDRGQHSSAGGADMAASPFAAMARSAASMQSVPQLVPPQMAGYRHRELSLSVLKAPLQPGQNFKLQTCVGLWHELHTRGSPQVQLRCMPLSHPFTLEPVTQSFPSAITRRIALV